MLHVEHKKQKSYTWNGKYYFYLLCKRFHKFSKFLPATCQKMLHVKPKIKKSKNVPRETIQA